MIETRKDIEGTGGKIKVSNLGRIKSFLRDERILKCNPDKKGYSRLRVTIERKKMCFKVHREVAKAFLCNPDNLPQVNHIDGNKRNNCADNLEWVSNLQNARHAIESGLWRHVFDASNKSNEKRKIKIIATNIKTNEQICFDSMSDAERILNTKHINAVIKGERKQANGYTFAYAS